MLPEFVAPDGVEIVTDDPRRPPYWTVYEDEQEKRGSDEVVLRPDITRRRSQAVVRPNGATEAEPWVYANGGGFITVYVPMRARQRLSGIGTPAPNCPQRDDGLPCPDDQVGDHLQRGKSKTVTANARGVARIALRGRRGKAKITVRSFADDGSVSAAASRRVRLR